MKYFKTCKISKKKQRINKLFCKILIIELRLVYFKLDILMRFLYNLISKSFLPY
jgi:hypothetical protein